MANRNMTPKGQEDHYAYIQEIKDYLPAYHLTVSLLKNLKMAAFPIGSKVFVDCKKYKGEGNVDLQKEVPPDKLAVLLENGNTWWYPIEKCKRI